MKLNIEIDYLEELIQEFGTSEKIPPEEAFELLRIRYEILEKNIPVFVKTLSEDKKKLKRFPFKKLIIDRDHYPAYFKVFTLLFHSLLFENILRNSGKLRNINEPYNGSVGFGGSSRRKFGAHKFYGSPCEKIDEELNEAFLLLRQNSKFPINDGLEFYRRFVKIHPFYDANGRIGRLILSIYLISFDLYINWRAIESGGNKNSFIKKLNECHKREGQVNYKDHFQHLNSFFKKFVVDIESLKDNTPNENVETN